MKQLAEDADNESFPHNPLRSYTWLEKRTGICRSTLASMVCRRQLPCVRLAKRIVRFDEAEIESWIASRRLGRQEVP